MIERYKEQFKKLTKDEKAYLYKALTRNDAQNCDVINKPLGLYKYCLKEKLDHSTIVLAALKNRDCIGIKIASKLIGKKIKIVVKNNEEKSS